MTKTYPDNCRRRSFFGASLFFGLCQTIFLSPVFAQVSEETNNQSKGSNQTFTITINSTHGVQSNASRTPDFNVETFGSLIVGPNSTSIQTNEDGAAGYMKTRDASGEGQTAGVSGLQRINFGEGTRYEVRIIPKTDQELCPAGAESCKIPNIGNANGSSVGTTSTSITVNSSESTFVNSFIKSFNAN